jgi:hypothetical protein
MRVRLRNGKREPSFAPVPDPTPEQTSGDGTRQARGAAERFALLPCNPASIIAARLQVPNYIFANASRARNGAMCCAP